MLTFNDVITDNSEAHAFFHVRKFIKNLVSKLHLAWIMAEIEPYSFEPMRDSSESERDDVHESQDEHRRGNTSWCVCECCANWEG